MPIEEEVEMCEQIRSRTERRCEKIREVRKVSINSARDLMGKVKPETIDTPASSGFRSSFSFLFVSGTSRGQKRRKKS